MSESKPGDHVNERTYEDGLRDGKIAALEKVAANHKERLDHHSNRLRTLERVAYCLPWRCGGD